MARIADNYNLKSPQIVDKKSVHDCIDGKVTIDDKTTEVRTMIDGNQDVETFGWWIWCKTFIVIQ